MLLFTLFVFNFFIYSYKSH